MTEPKSYRPMVLIEGKWSGNNLRFPTKEEAEANVQSLWMRWTGVEEVRVDPSEDEPNYRWDDFELIEIKKE